VLAREPIERVRIWLALGAMAFFVLAFLCCVELGGQLGFTRGTSRVAAFLAVAGGPLAVYGTRLQFNSHLLGALLVGFLLLAVARWCREPRLEYAVIAGFAAGLVIVNRWQDATIVAGALLPLAWPRPEDGFAAWLRRMAAVAAPAAAVGTVQLLAWKIQFGSWLLVPQGAGYLGLTASRLGSFLFSSYHGLVPWHPLFALALVLVLCLPLAPRLPRALAVGLAFAVATSVVVSSLPVDWWGGSSYGSRRLTSLTPVAAIALCFALRAAPQWLRAGLVALTLTWTIVNTSAFMSSMDDLSVPLRSRTSADHPERPAQAVSPRWNDRWGPFHTLRPGFTLTDRPVGRDRLVGLLLVSVIVAGTSAAWRLAMRERRVRRAAIVFAGAWVALAMGWLALRSPPNADANRAWQALLKAEPSSADVITGIPGLEAASAVVLAVKRLHAGDEAGFQRALAAIDDPARYQVDAAVLRTFVDTPAHRPLIDCLREAVGCH
jgi:hypothetical protein